MNKKYKKFDLCLLLSLIFFILFIIYFNYFVDPLDIFQSKYRFNLLRMNANKNHHISKVPALKNNKNYIYAIWAGSSKTGWCVNTDYDKSILGKNIVNMTINGASFYDVINVAKNSILIHPEIKEIYIGIDFYSMRKNFSEQESSIQLTQQSTITKEELLPLLFSLDMTYYSADTLFKNLLKKKKHTINIPYGEEKQHNAKVWHKFELYTKTFYTKYYAHYSLDENKFDILNLFIQEMNCKEIKVFIFATPMHVTERILIYTSGNLNDFYEYKRKLADIQPFYDFATVDKYTTEKITPDMQYFRDIAHCYPALRKKVSNQLFLSNEDYGTYITKNNVEKAIKQDNKYFQMFIKKNSNIVNMIKEWSK